MSAPTDLLGLDHMVIAVQSLDQAIADYRALGFTVVPGGQHPGRTSHNALVVFADGAYFELIAWQGPAPQERWWRTLTGAGEGFVDFALLPRDAVAALQAARGRGLDALIGPVDGGRLRPDGVRLHWQSVRHPTPDLPFLCGDVTPRPLRVPEGEVRRHDNGVQGVIGLLVAVHDLSATQARYRALLGDAASFDDGPPLGMDDPTIAALVQGADRASFMLGPTRFTLLSAGASTPSAHPLRERLQGRGEGPVALVMSGPPGSSARTLDPARAHGAWIRITPGA